MVLRRASPVIHTDHTLISSALVCHEGIFSIRPVRFRSRDRRQRRSLDKGQPLRSETLATIFPSCMHPIIDQDLGEVKIVRILAPPQNPLGKWRVGYRRALVCIVASGMILEFHRKSNRSIPSLPDLNLGRNSLRCRLYIVIS
jgi:hypothetical protein